MLCCFNLSQKVSFNEIFEILMLCYRLFRTFWRTLVSFLRKIWEIKYQKNSWGALSFVWNSYPISDILRIKMESNKEISLALEYFKKSKKFHDKSPTLVISHKTKTEKWTATQACDSSQFERNGTITTCYFIGSSTMVQQYNADGSTVVGNVPKGLRRRGNGNHRKK